MEKVNEAISDVIGKDLGKSKHLILVRNFVRVAEAGDCDAVKAVVESFEGFDVNEPRDEVGATALHVSVEQGHMEMIELLRELGADPMVEDDLGRLAINYACSEAVPRSILGYMHEWTFGEDPEAPSGSSRSGRGGVVLRFPAPGEDGP